ncbi:hypothetical protein [Streptomyces sp. CT34]|uniref:hypothetical protein n=1 Tax=Streptomyces sp. CT34 TaxID=1553907 RepID=UPI0005B8E2FB|nr:hypothetical protein [Streptomyces sp. CT34]
MTPTPHHHAYLWLGHGDVLVKPGDAHRRPTHPEFRAAQVMPLECADWLLKPAARIEATFHTPEDGAHWYAAQIARHAALFAGTYAPPADRRETVRILAAGEDRVGGWWVTGNRFLSVNIVACSPHHIRPEYGCPQQQ